MKKYEFDATLIRPEGVGTWTYFDIPLDILKLFGAKGQVRVRGTINGQPFRTSARPHGDGRHYIVVNRSIRDSICVTPGDVVQVVMERDTAPRTVEIPTDFADALAAKEKQRQVFEALSYSHKKEFVEWIESAKKEENRQRRIEKSLEMLLEDTSPKRRKK